MTTEKAIGHPPTQRDSSRSGAQTRQRVLEVARDLLQGRDDPEFLTVKRIAAAAGLSASAIYVHFESREALLVELALHEQSEHDARVSAALADVAEPLERIRRRLQANAEWATRNPGLFAVLWLGYRSPIAERFEHPSLLGEFGLGAFAEDVAAYFIDAGVAGDPVAEATVLWMNAFGFIAITLFLPDLPLASHRRVRDEYVDFQLRGLRALSPQAGGGDDA
jgi:AcrR family transcriptional regulator